MWPATNSRRVRRDRTATQFDKTRPCHPPFSARSGDWSIWSIWCVWFDKRERQDRPAHQIDRQESSLISHLSFHGSALRWSLLGSPRSASATALGSARCDTQECQRRAIRYAPSRFPKTQGCHADAEHEREVGLRCFELFTNALHVGRSKRGDPADYIVPRRIFPACQ